MYFRLAASLIAVALSLPACGKKATPPATTPPASTAPPATTPPATVAATTAPEADAVTATEDVAPAPAEVAAPVEEVAAPVEEVAAPVEEVAAPGTNAGAVDDDDPKGEPLPETSPFYPLCAAHAKAQELSEGWQCRVEKELTGGKGLMAQVAILRFTLFDVGATDHRVLAFQGDAGWALGPVILDTSVSGVGGVSMRGAVKEASLTLVGEAPLLVVRTYVHHYDSDMGVNAATAVEGEDLVVCSIHDGAARCATVAVNITNELSKVDEAGEEPPKEYGAVGKTSWSRTVTVGPDGAIVIGASQGKLERAPLEAAGTYSLADALGKKVPGVEVWPK